MQFGVCTSASNSRAVHAIGWDFIEENVQRFLSPTVDDDSWPASSVRAFKELPIPAANNLVPRELKIVGPDINEDALQVYMTRAINRAAQAGVTMLVFGSSGARHVPDGFDPAVARGQIISCLKMSAEIAHRAGLLIVIEPLSRFETNIINTIAEACDIASTVAHSNVKCLVDTYHFWMQDDSMVDLASAIPHIRHVHVADKDGRTAPGRTGKSDYLPIFKCLKQGGYAGRISVESPKFSGTEIHAEDVLKYLRRAWDAA